MSEAFATQVDIANRALQHCGARRITAFTDNSKNASATSFVYEKLRRAELRRNVWRFATRKAVLRPLSTTTLKIVAKAYDAARVYYPGDIVLYNGVTWITMTTTENQTPGVFPGPWDVYFGPMVCDQWNANNLVGIGNSGTVPTITTPEAYYAGDLVYETESQDGTTVTGSAGVAQVFISLANQNQEEPLLYTAYSSTATYAYGDVVMYGGFFYMSLINFNLNNEPDLVAQPWQTTISYAIGDKVLGSDGYIYTAINSSLNSDPTLTDPTIANPSTAAWQNDGVLGAWTPAFYAPTASQNWRRLHATVQPLQIVYPIGAGPSQQSNTRNVFMLPHGYLRNAPQDPKAGSVSFLGAPGERMYSDWTFENDYFTSLEVGPIVFRFVADVQNVGQFDDMFCEGMGARIALEVVEELTQSNGKLQAIGIMYKNFMAEARMVNGIEEGPTQLPLDDYLACRI